MKDKEVDNRSHQEIQDLLPWYVNETLTTVEREPIDAHLSQCSICLAELNNLQDLRSAVKVSNERLRFPGEAQIDIVAARVEQFESQRARWTILARFSGWWASLPTLSRRAFAAQAVALMVLAALSVALIIRARNLEAAALQERKRADVNESLLAQEKERAIEYQALSGGQRSDAWPGIKITVVFRESATEKEIRELLLSIKGAAIVSGPSPARFYVVGIVVPPGSDSQKTMNDAIAQLRRRNDVVQLAEPLP